MLQYAILSTKDDPNRKFDGIESYFALFNPGGFTGSQIVHFR
jgi:hypothetical protein